MHIRRRGIHGARQGAARGTRCRDGGGAPSGEADRDRGSDAMWDCGASGRPAVPCDCEKETRERMMSNTRATYDAYIQHCCSAESDNRNAVAYSKSYTRLRNVKHIVAKINYKAARANIGRRRKLCVIRKRATMSPSSMAASRF